MANKNGEGGSSTHQSGMHMTFCISFQSSQTTFKDMAFNTTEYQQESLFLRPKIKKSFVQNGAFLSFLLVFFVAYSFKFMMGLKILFLFLLEGPPSIVLPDLVICCNFGFL